MPLTLKEKASRTVTALRQRMEAILDERAQLSQRDSQLLEQHSTLAKELKDWEDALKPPRKKPKPAEKAE